MSNWLQEFYKVFKEAIEQHTGIAQDLGAVEHALDSERAAGLITPQILRSSRKVRHGPILGGGHG